MEDEGERGSGTGSDERSTLFRIECLLPGGGRRVWLGNIVVDADNAGLAPARGSPEDDEAEVDCWSWGRGGGPIRVGTEGA